MSNFGTLDLCIVGLYFAATIGIGLWSGRRERDTCDFFLGGRRQPWFIVSLSIVATEVSALTFLVVPGHAFASDYWYLQLYAGSFVARCLIAYLLLPAFYGNRITTVYEYLGRRFGPWTRSTASLMFFASRLLGSGLRLLAASIALAMVLDWSLPAVVLGCASIAIAYAAFGGIKAIIWTDALQAMVFIGGGLAAVVFLFTATPGPWTQQVSLAASLDKLNVIHTGWNPNHERLFWVLAISALFQTMAAMGTDQDMTQRMLTCADLRRGQRSLLFNAAVGLPVVCLFLVLGTGLFVFYHPLSGVAAPSEPMRSVDRIFAYFIANDAPSSRGLKGLLVAGLLAAAMSSLDSALGALTSTAVTDFYRPYLRRNETEAHYVRTARWLTILFGALLASVALAFAGAEDLLSEAFGWVGLFSGAMLGIFLLGVLTKRRGRDGTNVIAMTTSVAFLIVVKWWQEKTDNLWIAWPWWVVIGTLWTLLVAALSPTPNPRSRHKLPPHPAVQSI